MPMAFAVSVAVLLGLLAGAAARRAALAFTVPTGQPPRTLCPHCDTPITSTALRTSLGRCHSCSERLGAPALLPEVLTVVLWGLVVAAAGVSWTAAALLWLSACGVALALADWTEHVLPDRLTLPTGLGLAVLLGVAAAAEDHGGAFLRALGGALVLGLFYLLVALVSNLGLGDVKLAPVLGAALAWFGWLYLIPGLLLGFFLGALYGVGLLALRRASAKAKIAFGPFMIAGTLGVCLLAAR
ncbi:prepilin peptidase [Streptacidiphilus jiangxiensis]|uniref:Leader peptidase (Prepilin peptidase) / N-methyltransferase n=1 Tax=Streptacidiphilus jiangxiensis TaxID=235985 RepID=A0A1H8B1E5_STRJI|nr:A24 family peptidase [Streptacidiphilus jiangxiensis]SEM76613.1 leader peptidase (prepilin peptidase) / N-methyltransferase [Streptacidiphilus jiangxiensis]